LFFGSKLDKIRCMRICATQCIALELRSNMMVETNAEMNSQWFQMSKASDFRSESPSQLLTC
jgi:Na+-translocating ferredoxin:NAD+ oxidoreductase RnfC subunit